MICQYVHCEESLAGLRKGARFHSRLCKERNRTHKCLRAICTGISPRDRNRAVINAAKSHPCVDCGISYPHYVMDLDHLPEFEKSFELSDAKTHSLARILDEIKKCEPVCANCHRVRTWNRLQVDLDRLKRE